MEKSAFGHLSDNLPQLSRLHTFLCETEHHSRVYIRSSLLCETVLEFGGPYCTLFLLSNAADDLAGFFRKRRE
jgi:hypothetical protein